MRINQAYVSESVKKFKPRWFKMFNLVDYNNPLKPAVFFYNTIKDLDAILRHKSKSVVVITSSHLEKLDYVSKKLVSKNIKILATSQVSKKLTELGIRHEWPKCGIFVEKVEPVKLGNMVYTYAPRKTKKYIETYGIETLTKIKTNFEILIGYGYIDMDKWYGEEINNYFSKVFIGLNLSTTSAGQTSIVDLGLRGIKCITNVTSMPHTIPWKTVEDIENIIQKESENIGKINYDLAREVYESMDYEQKWLEVD